MSVWGSGGVIPRFNSHAEAPTAAAYGVGQALIGASLYWSNGSIWREISSGNTSRTVVLVGDSNNDRATWYSESYSQYPANAAVNWGLAGVYQRVYLPFGIAADGSVAYEYNYAESGTTSIDVINSQLASAIALNPGFICVRTGINDLAGVSPASTSESATTVFNRLRTICETILAAGIIPIIFTLNPRAKTTGAGSWSTAGITGSTFTNQSRKLLDINNKLRRYASERRRVVLVDSWAATVDFASADGEPLSGYTEDGLHESATGAFVTGKVMATALAAVLPSIEYSVGPSDVYDATNNPQGNQLTASGAFGPGSGTYATGWTSGAESGSGGSVTATNASRADGKNGFEQRLEITSTGTEIRRFLTSPNQTSLVASAEYVFEADIDISANSGPLNGFDLRMALLTAVPTQQDVYALKGSSALPNNFTFSGRLRTPGLVSPAAPTNSFVWPRFHLVNGSSLTATIKNARFFNPANLPAWP